MSVKFWLEKKQNYFYTVRMLHDESTTAVLLLELLHIQVFITVCFDADFVNFTTKVCFLIPHYNLWTHSLL